MQLHRDCLRCSYFIRDVENTDKPEECSNRPGTIVCFESQLLSSESIRYLLLTTLQVWLRYTTTQQGLPEDSNYLKVTYPERQYSALQDEFDLINEVERQTGMSLVFLVDVEKRRVSMLGRIHPALTVSG